MRYYPVFLEVEGKWAVVIGGGPVALRKAKTLAEAGAKVAVISPEVVPGLMKLAEDGVIELIRRPYRAGDLDGASVAVAATNDRKINREFASEAGRHGIPVNCATPPSAGSFIVPSSTNRSGLTLAISTGGISPALSKRLRKSIEDCIESGYGPLLDFLARAREEVKARVPDTRKRSAILDTLVNSDIVDMFIDDPASALPEAEKRLDAMVSGAVLS